MTGIQIILLIAAVMGGIFVFVPLLAHWYGFRGIKRKTVGDGQHGTARWAEKKEIGQVYTRLPFEPEKWRADPDSRPAAQGIVVGCETHNGRTVALVDTGDVHCLMIGAAGVGKTAYWLYPNIEYACASGLSFFTTDTKGDLLRNYGSIASRYYGYKITVIDLRNPMHSHGNNPLHLVNKYMDLAVQHPERLEYRAKAERYAKIISKTVILSGMEGGNFGQNSYFYDAAEGLLTASILLVAEFCAPEERHIVSVFRIIQDLTTAKKDPGGIHPFRALLELLPAGHKARWFAGAALNSSEGAMASVLSTAMSRLNVFLDSELETILCSDTGIDAEQFCREKSAVFIIMPEEDNSRYFMVSLLIQQLYRELLVVADENGGRLQNRVMFYCDEWGTLPKIESAEMMFSASRSRGISMVPVIQSFAQLEKNYGKEGAEIIVDNTQLTIFGGFAPNSGSAEKLSQAMGSETVLTGSITQSKADGSRSLQMMERPLMTTNELKSLPKGTFIVTKTGFFPMRVRLKLFFEWGIRFEQEPYRVPIQENGLTAYASREKLTEAILKKYPKPKEEAETTGSANDIFVEDKETGQNHTGRIPRKQTSKRIKEEREGSA